MTLKRLSLFAMLSVIVAGSLGCLRSTEGTETGIKIRKFAKNDVIVPPGQTVPYLPFFHDWYVYDQKQQVMEMKKTEQYDDALDFKTVDGNDIHVDLTIQWRIDPAKAPELLRTVGASMEEIGRGIVRPLARSIPRDVFNELTSEQFYNSDNRTEKQRKAHAKLNEALEEYGIICDGVILGDYRFDAEYQKAIDDKKVADQKVNKNKSAAEAAREEWKRKLEETKGQVGQQIAAAKGKARQRELEADAYYEAKALEAEALLAEMTAQAEGLRKQRQAIAGSGGRTMVKLAIAKALKGKRIVLVPVGDKNGLNLQRTDINQLLQTLGVESEAASSSSSSSGTPFGGSSQASTE